jgi:hypothetical protein
MGVSSCSDLRRCKRVQQVAAKRNARKIVVNAIKHEKGCATCGETDPRCLDFHHLHDKKRAIGDAVKSWNIDRVIREMFKCIILCANCHRKLHKGTSL